MLIPKLKVFLKEHIFNFLILLIVSGRFYFIFGFTGALRPVVDPSIIISKDVIFIGLSLYVFITFKEDCISFFKAYNKTITSVLSLLVITLVMHSAGKSYYTISWYYVRNIYMYLAFIPISYVLTQKKRISLECIWNSFLLVNLFFSVAELVWFRNSLLDHTRPLGIVGDPIISSLFNYLLLFKICVDKTKIYRLPIFFLLCICIDSQASVTAFIAIISAFVLVVATHFKLVRDYILKFVLLFIVFISICFIQIKDNDLSWRLTCAYYGTVAKYIKPVEGDQSDCFQGLARGRLTSSSFFKNRGVLMDVKTFLWGAYKDKEYYRIDSSFLSLFKNHGVFGLGLYYLFLSYILYLCYGMRSLESVPLTLFVVTVLFLGVFCSTIYKFPITPFLALYLGDLQFRITKKNTI